MLHIENFEDGIELYKALGSEVRVEIIKLLIQNKGMNMNELATASRYHIPIIEIVIDNHVLGMVRQWQTLYYGARYSATVLKDNVDYCKVAEGLGCRAINVTSIEELEPALKEALASTEPILVNCVIEEDDKVFPMVSPGSSIEEAFDETDINKSDNQG